MDASDSPASAKHRAESKFPSMNEPDHVFLEELQNLDRRLTTIENSAIFSSLRGVGTLLNTFKRRAGSWLLTSPLHPLYLKFRRTTGSSDPYPDWLELHRKGDPFSTPASPGQEIAAGHLISVVIPVYKPRLEWLREVVGSVTDQTSARWQLCLCIDRDLDANAENYLREVAAQDTRIVLSNSGQAGISGTLNGALKTASGDYVAFVDQDDLLERTALSHVQWHLARDPVDLLYTDEGLIDENANPLQPNFKPDWSPELLLSCMYIGHLLVISRNALTRAGGFRSEFDGAQDYDLVLRLHELGMRVGHIPRVLYHWRRHPESSASGIQAKPYAEEAGLRALSVSMKRRGWAGTVEIGARPNTFVLTGQQSGDAATILIATRNALLLEKCIDSIRRHTHPASYQILVIHHLGGDDDDRIQRTLAHYEIHSVPYAGTFNFAAMNNQAARLAAGGNLVFLNDDVYPLNGDWLRRMTWRLAETDVGIVGARLVYPAGTIQHAGIVLGMSDGTGHPGRHLIRSSLWPWIDQTRDVSAVTGACLAIRSSVFSEAGGFDERFPVNYNDVDLCLRVREAGYRVVLENGAVLVHAESSTRKTGTTMAERILFRRRWGHRLEEGDAFFNPNLQKDTEDLALKPGSP